MTIPTLHTSTDQGWTIVDVGTPTQTNWYKMRESSFTATAGDLIHLVGHAVVRDDLGYGCEVARMQTIGTTHLSSYYGDTTPESSAIGPITGDGNVISATHYQSAKYDYYYTIPTTGTYYVATWVRSRSTDSNGAQNLTVMADQGYLEVAHFTA